MLKPRILIVEDKNIVVKDLQGRLEKMEYTVSAVASTGKEAIQKASFYKPDLVLMDIVLR